MENQFVSSEVRGRVGIVTLNRPKQLNALNDQLIDEMGKELQTFLTFRTSPSAIVRNFRGGCRGQRIC